MTDQKPKFEDLPQHVRDAMQHVADLAGSDVKNVDPVPFLDLPAPLETPAERARREVQEAHARRRQRLDVAAAEETKRLASADLPTDDKIAAQARAYGIDPEMLKQTLSDQRDAAQAQVEAANKTLAQQREAERQAVLKVAYDEALQEAKAGHFTALVNIGQSQANPHRNEARAAVAELWPAFDAWTAVI